MNSSGDQPSAEPGPAGSRRARLPWLARLAVPLGAAALLVAGAVLLARPVQQVSLGWFAYAPLSQQTFLPDSLLVMDPGRWTGIWLIGAGLLTLAFWAGFRTGRRTRRRGGA
ncbi:MULTISPECIES: hypothetical protein [unclassified Arthrobacter]|uniref:hypothetical protein n=1 Tax=unclassified Arthrobacter TaxID=235627 RepID=UPI002E0B994A|nr:MULTISPECIES: hypothetical protein [unclassified Arthrobacter]MEC5189810.1 heme/copper-type cytochrome/quinol oxidase subunit 1 [Arthrobacter sp. MP_M4]MEC5201277.1 heme/copper-type cytochrome/quinol oxidase subunit 1 [Arthrobacter sp. MP_M7]